MQRLAVEIRIWFASLVLCALGVALAFWCADVPIAQACARYSRLAGGLSEGLGGAIVLSFEIAAVGVLVFARLLIGKLSPFGEALALACLTSICTYALNSNVLKIYFGVPNPGAMMHGASHAFHFWKGSPNSSFPSGHMALAGAFSGVFMRLYRRSIWPFAFFLLLAASLLVIGHWHFISDVIAGAFLGVSAGLIAAELWKVHSSQRPV